MTGMMMADVYYYHKLDKFTRAKPFMPYTPPEPPHPHNCVSATSMAVGYTRTFDIF
jgi:hypothetical protein